jgi:hypothetical protein
MRRKRKRAAELRQAIDCLPERTRRAMLDGIDQNQIIVGAYTDNAGGVCPMLAAHRNGGRTSLASFARAWDAYTGGFLETRPATKREVRTLRAMLEASLWTDGVQSDLAAAVQEHRDKQVERALREEHDEMGERASDHADSDVNREPELRKRPGWAWLRTFRRYDEYEAALGRELERDRIARDGAHDSEPAEAELEKAGT